MIVRARETGLPWPELEASLHELKTLCTTLGADNVRARLMAIATTEPQNADATS